MCVSIMIAAHSPGPVVGQKPTDCLSDVFVRPDWPAGEKQITECSGIHQKVQMASPTLGDLMSS